MNQGQQRSFNNNNQNGKNPNNNGNNNNNNKDNSLTHNAFAMMIPGRPMNTLAKRISNTRILMQIPNPGLITKFGISILNVNKLPKKFGFTVFYSLPDNKKEYKDWNYIGVLHYEKPTELFDAPWTTRKKISTCPNARIGFELKPIDFVKSLELKETQTQSKQKFIQKVNSEFAMKIANDLYKYLNSFVKTTNNGELLVVPANCLDKWKDRFQRKYILDPKFMDN